MESEKNSEFVKVLELKRFLETAIYLQDQLYTRVADLEVDSQVFGADFYYHKNCLEG